GRRSRIGLDPTAEPDEHARAARCPPRPPGQCSGRRGDRLARLRAGFDVALASAAPTLAVDDYARLWWALLVLQTLAAAAVVGFGGLRAGAVGDARVSTATRRTSQLNQT